MRDNFHVRAWVRWNCRTAVAICGALLWLSTTAPLASAEDAEPIPPALKEYMGRQIAPTMHYLGADWLMRETRQREEDCQTMFSQLGVKPGMSVCDMGCGNGFYTVRLSDAVGREGRVFAVDIQ